MSGKENKTSRPAGYEALVEWYNLEVIPNQHKSFISTSGTHRIRSSKNIVEEVYPPTYCPGDTCGDHLEFALKYDGTNLLILSALFEKIEKETLTEFIKNKPTGKYTRRLWFLYEFLTGIRLQLDDLNMGNYIDLLDPEEYYTVRKAQRIRRQRIMNNLPGNSRFCPTIRRTNTLQRYEAMNLPEQCRNLISRYPPELLRRVLSYLYFKETKTSFEIEHITPGSNRTERFIALLQLSEHEDFCEKDKLVNLQNHTVDPRFAENDYRKNQNYVGETIVWQSENIHYVPPKPEDVHDLMKGLIGCNARIKEGEVHPVIHAAITAYGFVFIHPFEDGNGRIHRFLIHNILAQRGFTPEGILFPVSASMLRNRADYDASLETFSRPLMALVDYSLDKDGKMTVHNDTAALYRYIDMTTQAESLFRFIELTITTELPEELTFLANYDTTKKTIQEIVDMPDRKIDLFIRLCLQNNGRLSKRKRDRHFAFLVENEITRMEHAIQSTYGLNSGNSNESETFQKPDR